MMFDGATDRCFNVVESQLIRYPYLVVATLCIDTMRLFGQRLLDTAIQGVCMYDSCGCMVLSCCWSIFVFGQG